jgi:anti-anti-sigma factor
MKVVEPHLHIREHRDTDGTLILSVNGALDERTASGVAERITESMSPHWALILDLDGVDSLDAPGLSALLAATNRARASGCSVSLDTPRGPFLRLLRRAGLETVLPLRTDEFAPRVRGRFARIAGRG